MTRRPVIGITLDSEEPGGYSKMPWYAIRKNYCEAVTEAGGVPVLLPHEVEMVPAYLDMIQGLVISGGAFDLDPVLFGAQDRHASVTLKPGRSAFELALVRGALDRDMPILGICGGLQVLAVVLGGSLIQHIPDEVPGALNHEQPGPHTQTGHEVELRAGSRLAHIAGAARIAVNSTHHQAVKTVGPGCVISATAPDGVVEAIELPGKRFCIGVQWHPEYHVNPTDTALLRALVEACC